MAKEKKNHRKLITALAVIISLFIAFGLLMPTLSSITPLINMLSQLSSNPTADQITEAARPDERGYRIDALEDYEDGESWAIYIYMIGSNLESGNINSLSDLTNVLIADEVEENTKRDRDHYLELIRDFTSDVEANGMDLPNYFYNPVTPKVFNPGSDVTELDYWYCGSSALHMIRDTEIKGDLKIVIQTGGSNAWSDITVNPNKSERFVADKDGFRKVESNPLVNMAKPESVSDFLRFCQDGYDADHKMVVFFNHGSGAFGYGQDEIFNHMLSLKDIRKAFSDVYGDNPSEKPFDIIGFYCCLMATVETVNELYEYGDYMVASEEVLYLPPGWDFVKIINALNDNPDMHAEKLGKEIVDGYVEAFAATNIQNEMLMNGYVTTLSLVNMDNGKKVYDAYLEFAKSVLVDATTDLSAIANISKAGKKAIVYGINDYDAFNEIDLKTFMEASLEYYPDEAKSVLDALESAVLYARGTFYGNNSGGLSVYYPLNINRVNSILYMLLYINDVTDDDVLKALYYYKLAGCLNEEYTEFVKTLGQEGAIKLDTSSLEDLINANIEINGSEVRIPVSKEQHDLLQHSEAIFAKINGNIALDLGTSGRVRMDEDAIVMDVDGGWININGDPLPIEYVGTNGSSITYSVHVIYNGLESYLMLNLDEETKEVTLIGVNPSGEADSDAVRADRMVTLKNGDTFSVIYTSSNLDDSGIGINTELGDKSYTIGRENIRYSSLPNGSYLLNLSGFDFRGDEYFTPSLTFNMRGGNVENLKVDESYRVVLVD